MTRPNWKSATHLLHAGADPEASHGAVNPPVYHASTILSSGFDAYEARLSAPIVYGRSGTPTTKALETALSELEGSEGTILAPSGVAAIALVLSAFARPGGEILITDAVYEPVRKFAAGPLAQYGTTVRFYDPSRLDLLETLITPDTALIWLESPASQTFEMQDLRTSVAIAKKHSIQTATDNTWATGYFCRPLDLGVDICVLAATKYIGGHSDLMMGTVSASGEAFARLQDFSRRYGYCVAGDDAYLALRGLRTLPVRLDRHNANALQLAQFLAVQPGVERVMHPALPGDPGHALWQRDFTGSSGLFGFVLQQRSRDTMRAFFDGLRLYGMGGSWGGYESLLIPTWPEKGRQVARWQPGGQTMRIHVGLEDPFDLIEDLTRGLERWNAGV